LHGLVMVYGSPYEACGPLMFTAGYGVFIVLVDLKI
jgi:hypothetical protein